MKDAFSALDPLKASFITSPRARAGVAVGAADVPNDALGTLGVPNASFGTFRTRIDATPYPSLEPALPLTSRWLSLP